MHRLPIALALFTGSAYAEERYTSEPQPVVFEGSGEARDVTYTLPLGFQLDVIVGQYWLGVIPGLKGNVAFSLAAEGVSTLSWRGDDGEDGLLIHQITPTPGSGTVGCKTGMVFRVDMALYSAGTGPVGSPLLTVPVLTENLPFEFEGEPFTPFLLPGQHPNSAHLAPRGGDFGFSLPLVVPIGLADVASVSGGPLVVGEPRFAATFGGRDVAVRAGETPVGASGELQMLEAAPRMALEADYSVFVDSSIAYQFTSDLSFDLEVKGVSVFPIEVPLWGQAFPLFNSLVNLEFPVVSIDHPLPMVAWAGSSSLDAGVVQTGGAASVGLELRNEGELRLEGGLAVDGSAVFGVSPVDVSLAPGETVQVSIDVAPTDAGEATATLRFTSNDPYRPLVTWSVRVEGHEVDTDSSPLQPGDDSDVASDTASDTGADPAAGLDSDSGTPPATIRPVDADPGSCGCAQGAPWSGAPIGWLLLVAVGWRRKATTGSATRPG